jgi:hypothetical protein
VASGPAHPTTPGPTEATAVALRGAQFPVGICTLLDEDG